MKKYLVITASEGDTGLRVYSSSAPNAVIALRNAMREDFNNYPDWPSKFDAVEVIEAESSELSI